MKAYIFIAGLVATAATSGNAAAQTSCTPELYAKADAAIDSVKTWTQLYNFYQSYGACQHDGGAIDESLSDDVGRLLAYHWGGLGKIHAVLREDPGFAGLVLAHIDSTWDPKEFTPALLNVGTKCSADLMFFCANAMVSIKQAQAESARGAA